VSLLTGVVVALLELLPLSQPSEPVRSGVQVQVPSQRPPPLTPTIRGKGATMVMQQSLDLLWQALAAHQAMAHLAVRRKRKRHQVGRIITREVLVQVEVSPIRQQGDMEAKVLSV
jgi:hypothetical protein